MSFARKKTDKNTPVADKIQATKKEIQTLNTEFEKLINLGTNAIHNAEAIPAVPEEPTNHNEIKKQKCKRTTLETHKVSDLEARMQERRKKEQRLKDLQQKSREIVTKNVERARSKSGDRGIPVRLDGARSTSMSALVSERHLLNSRIRNEPPQMCNRLSRAQSRPPVVATKGKAQPPSLKQNVCKVAPPKIIIENVETRVLQDENGQPLTSRKTPESSVSDELGNLDFPPFKNITLRRDSDPKDDMNEKETQTNPANELGEGLAWTETPYPYNFINTVKSKLQLAVNSPKYTSDVGVQSSFRSEPVDNNKSPVFREIISKNSSPLSKAFVPEQPNKSKSPEFHEIIAQNSSSYSSLKSFVSHRNLDLKTVEKLELVTGKKSPIGERYGSISKRLFLPESAGSESDTSKNIPDISSESISSRLVRSKQKTIDPTMLGLDQLEGLKLSTRTSMVAPSVMSNVKTENSYTSDFVASSKSEISNGNSETSTISTDSTEKSRPVSRASTLREPPLSLNFTRGDGSTGRHNKTTSPKTIAEKAGSNRIHLKFEAEVHLLNDYHDSLNQLMKVESAFEHFKRKNENLQNFSDTAKTSTTNGLELDVSRKSLTSNVNFSRGSDRIQDESAVITVQDSTLSTLEWNLTNPSNANTSEVSCTTKDETDVGFSLSNLHNEGDLNVCAGLSLNMFDQLIKEEDCRIAQLTANLKIRQQALLSRTRSELTFLEMYRKQLTETGRLEEASVIKKKQRGILLRHQQESNEIDRLKQTKKGESKERKLLLKRQKNLIKTGLSSKSTLMNIKIASPSKRQNRGPLVVFQNCSSPAASTDSAVSALEESVVRIPDAEITNLKRTLCMREEVLKERRKAVEDLLQWHRRLVREEEQITKLERIASTLVRNKRPIKKSHKVAERASPPIGESQHIPESSASKKSSEISSDKSETIVDEVGSNKSEYSNVFEAESEENIPSISDLINDFSRIESELSDFEKNVEDVTPGHAAGDSGAPLEITMVEDKDDSNKTVIEEPDEVKSSISEKISEEPLEILKVSEINEEIEQSPEVTPQRDEIELKSVDLEKPEDLGIENEFPLVPEEVEEVSTSNPTEVSTSTTMKDIHSNEIPNDDESSESSSRKCPEFDENNTPKKNSVDVKKRVSEILADANVNVSRGDKSPRLQDLYNITYDVVSPTSPESTEDLNTQPPGDIFGSEAEELLKKQLAIEQEIKQLELQQQIQQAPYVFMREIPNKPPPPYTPPSSISSSAQYVSPTDPKEIDEITKYTSKVLYKAYEMNNMENVKFSVNSFKLMSNLDISKNCCEYVFNLSKDMALEHYDRFKSVENEPCWLKLEDKSATTQLSTVKPLDGPGLEKLLNYKLKQLFGFIKTDVNESAIIKWGEKKRDHVDEVLVNEDRRLNSAWTDIAKNELYVKDEMVNKIMKSLIADTVRSFLKIKEKRESKS